LAFRSLCLLAPELAEKSEIVVGMTKGRAKKPPPVPCRRF
jgi:hypothetical protein